MNRRDRWLLVGLLVVAAFLRIVRLGELSLIGDESYYWLWSQRLDWAYYDHPAGVSLLVRASTTLGGSSEVGIRWLNALLGIGCVFLTYHLGQRLLCRWSGLLAAALVAVGAPYLITSRFVYTNTLHLFMLLLNLCAFWRLGERREPRPATVGAFGVSLALLFNTTYSAYLYAGALFVAVLLDHRHLLAKWRFWAGVAVGALGLVPVIAWNAGHEWASFRWQLTHATTSVAGTYSLLGNARHALAYVTWPVMAVALAGVGRVRTRAERLLSIVAGFLLLPVALSPANSPRNLVAGLVVLFLLAGTRLSPSWQGWGQRAAVAACVVLVLTAVVFGAGTVANLVRPSPWPRSSVVPAILRDAAGWNELGPVLAAYPGPTFALDYNVAAQTRYYAGRPAYTSWGQYRIWGIPPLQDVVVVSLEYLPEDLISARLGDAFRHVQGPERLRYAERGVTKEVRIWHARELTWDQETFLQAFDFLALLEAAR